MSLFQITPLIYLFWLCSSFTGQSDTLREKHPGTEEFEFLETGIKQCNDQLQFLEAQKAQLEAHKGQSSRISLCK